MGPGDVEADMDASMIVRQVALTVGGTMLAGLFGFVGCHPKENADWRAAKARWEQAGIEDYTITFHTAGAWARGEPITVVVRGGRAPDGTNPVEDFFVEIHDQLHDPEAGKAFVQYDPADGHPVSMGFDPIELAVDDEYAISVDAFQAD